MSIELDNPEGVLGKVDAASNFVAQIRLAYMVGDKKRVEHALDRAEALLHEAVVELNAAET